VRWGIDYTLVTDDDEIEAWNDRELVNLQNAEGKKMIICQIR
jgi:hypothetical protein